jgi:hypothetical protein
MARPRESCTLKSPRVNGMRSASTGPPIAIVRDHYPVQNSIIGLLNLAGYHREVLRSAHACLDLCACQAGV